MWVWVVCRGLSVYVLRVACCVLRSWSCSSAACIAVLLVLGRGLGRFLMRVVEGARCCGEMVLTFWNDGAVSRYVRNTFESCRLHHYTSQPRTSHFFLHGVVSPFKSLFFFSTRFVDGRDRPRGCVVFVTSTRVVVCFRYAP